MKVNFKILVLMGALSFGLLSCDKDDKESCQNDDGICTVDVTVCCTEGSDQCKYTVGDKEYNSLNEALQASECTASANIDDQASARIALENLTARAKANF